MQIPGRNDEDHRRVVQIPTVTGADKHALAGPLHQP